MVIVIEVRGKYGVAKVFTDNIDEKSREQIQEIMDTRVMSEGRKIRVMPDVHAGKGCVIGFTSEVGDKVVPNLVGVDIGCGMLTIKIGKVDVDLEELDRVIKEGVPVGYNVNDEIKDKEEELEELLQGLKIPQIRDKDRVKRSVGSLGSGNHFIELAEGKDGCKYIVIHTGSRNLGQQVAGYYQDKAEDLNRGLERTREYLDKMIVDLKEMEREGEIEGYLREYHSRKEIEGRLKLYKEVRVQRVIKDLKEEGQEQKIAEEIDKVDKEVKEVLKKVVPKELSYLEGELRDNYLSDMGKTQEYATRNRKVIGQTIVKGILGKDLEDMEYMETVHNYIDLETNILRKGAISAERDEMVLIPINMRDGSILARGKGNEDWNKSAPHGAGRVLSRSQARAKLKIEDIKEQMRDVYTTTLTEDTIDEGPDAYKGIEDIRKHIGETVEIVDILKPLYNFKG